MELKEAFVVQINMRDGSKKYVSADRYRRFSLVSTKNRAFKFMTDHQAEIFSDYFWEKAWNKGKYESREVSQINFMKKSTFKSSAKSESGPPSLNWLGIED
jgi:hypothetical protein